MVDYKRYQDFIRLFAGVMILTLGAGLLTSCNRELTPEKALTIIQEQDEFQMPYYAPMRIGEQVLTGDNHKNPDQYIRKLYGSLIDAGLVEVKKADSNSWRTVIDVQLTAKGRAMCDGRRTTEREAYVQVCRMVPVKIEEFRTVTEGRVVECSYRFEEQEITPFGVCQGFTQGRSYKDKRTFVRARGSWHVE